MTLWIKTGMDVEDRVAKTYAAKDVLVLTGEYTADQLAALRPQNCSGIVSFGLCGGLWTGAQIGQAFIYDTIVTPTASFACDAAWRRRLFAATKYYEAHCWSSGDFNTANTVEERAALYSRTRCQVIDDESFAVAEFASRLGVPLMGLRVVSDGAEDDLPPAVLDALNSNGTTNIWDVVDSLFTEPIDPATKQLQVAELIKTAGEYNTSVAELRTAIVQAGPQLQLS